MKKILSTDKNNILALIARLTIGIVILPHGAQYVFGWFGGVGFQGTIDFLTQDMNLPYVVGLAVILIEFFGALFLIFGFLTRLAALGIIANFTGVVITAHSNASFFMNWAGEANLEEGLEYFVLLFGLTIISLTAGGGKLSLDAWLMKKIKTKQVEQNAIALKEN